MVTLVYGSRYSLLIWWDLEGISQGYALSFGAYWDGQDTTDPIYDALVKGIFGGVHKEQDDLYYAVTNHPAHQQYMKDLITRMVTVEGFEGVYMDNPFVEYFHDYGTNDGYNPDNYIGMRQTFENIADILAEHAEGGVVISEQSREGRRAMDGNGTIGMGGVIPGANNVPFNDAIFHDYKPTGFGGDLTTSYLQIIYADSRLLPELGVENNWDHLHRLAIDSAVNGRSLVDMPPYLGAAAPRVWKAADELQFKALLDSYSEQSMRTAIQLRQDYPVVTYGRMLPPPISSVDMVEVHFVELEEPPVGRMYTALTEKYPVSFWADPTDENTMTLLVGNPTNEEISISFEFTADEYAEFMKATSYDVEQVLARGEGGTTLGSFDGTFQFQVTVPALDIAVVTLTGR